MSNAETKSQPSVSDSNSSSQNDPALQRIREALRGLRYGSVNIIVQDGLVIQIDRLEKLRLRNSIES